MFPDEWIWRTVKRRSTGVRRIRKLRRFNGVIFVLDILSDRRALWMECSFWDGRIETKIIIFGYVSSSTLRERFDYSKAGLILFTRMEYFIILNSCSNLTLGICF